jgi:hypothetical protein
MSFAIRFSFLLNNINACDIYGLELHDLTERLLLVDASLSFSFYLSLSNLFLN